MNKIHSKKLSKKILCDLELGDEVVRTIRTILSQEIELLNAYEEIISKLPAITRERLMARALDKQVTIVELQTILNESSSVLSLEIDKVTEEYENSILPNEKTFDKGLKIVISE